MNPLRALRRAMSIVLPWPPRHQRRADIARARSERERSAAGAAHAAGVEAEIRKIAARNHIAEAIRADIIRRHRGEAT